MKQLLYLAGAMALLLAAPIAHAHTTVRETSIANNAHVGEAPDMFTITFSAETVLASVTLSDSAGRQIALSYAPSRTPAARFAIPLPDLAPGGYVMSWRTIARDGHAMPGQVRFHVGGRE